MVNWNKVIKEVKSIAVAHSKAKAAEAALLKSAANDIVAVKQAAKEHENVIKAMTRICNKCGVSADFVFVVCDSAHTNDEKVKALIFNGDVIGPIIEACNTNDTNDNKEE